MIDVIVAGAGPNGLLLACELALAGVKPVVLDVLPGPSDEPKANGLIGQVIRQLDMRGLYQLFTGSSAAPEPTPGWMFAGIPLDFSTVEPNPMHRLLLAQPQLVRLLARRAAELAVEIRWGHEVTGLDNGPDRVGVEIHTANGDYRLSARYLVGADGGRSPIRKKVGIGFPGHTLLSVARIAHVRLPRELYPAEGGYDVPGHGWLPFGHNRFDNGVVVFFPFEPDRPMVGTIEFGRSPRDTAAPMTIGELRASVRRVLGADLPIEAPLGPGPHALRRIEDQNTRHAERYRAGRVLLLGDAAHVHSAMGGPGLNLGLGDTMNLGWKLAAEINGRAPAGLLDTYQSERYPVGERVMMHSQSQTALIAPGPEVAALRMLFAELAGKPAVADHLAHLLAGSDVRYEVGDEHEMSGRMVPDLTLDDGRRVADFLHRGRPVLLDLGAGVDSAADGWSDRVDVVTGRFPGAPAAILIRPDGYVAWAAETFALDDARRLSRALERWFGPALSSTASRGCTP